MNRSHLILCSLYPVAMQSITFSGKPCLDPLYVRSNQSGQVDLSRLHSLANPLGMSPSMGYFAISKSDLDDLTINDLHTVVFDDDAYGTVTAYNLVITEEPVKAYSHKIGSTVPEDMAYLVKVSDQRWLCHNPYYHISINKQYNVRARGWGSGTYYDDSRNTGSDWTWSTMVEDIWGELTPLGDFPGLPITPTGTPEGWQFIGVSAWKALCDVLDQIGCAVNWNPTLETNPFTIVQVGAADADTSALLDSLETDNRKIYDGNYQSVVRGRVPYGVRVFFHRTYENHGTEPTTQKTTGQWQTSSAYTIDKAGPDTKNAEAGLYHPIWSDLPAVYNASGTLQNSSALDDAAEEEKDNFYRNLRDGGDRLHRTYDGVVSLSPGSTLRGVAWYTSPRGELLTDIIRHPFRMVKVGEGKAMFEEVQGSSSSNQPAVLGPQFPNVQPLEQVIELASGTPSSGLYSATIQRVTTAPSTWTDQESVWGLDLYGATSLTSGDRYKARLITYHSSRPVYAFDSRGSVSYEITEGRVIAGFNAHSEPSSGGAQLYYDTGDSGWFDNSASYDHLLQPPTDGQYLVTANVVAYQIATATAFNASLALHNPDTTQSFIWYQASNSISGVAFVTFSVNFTDDVSSLSSNTGWYLVLDTDKATGTTIHYDATLCAVRLNQA